MDFLKYLLISLFLGLALAQNETDEGGNPDTESVSPVEPTPVYRRSCYVGQGDNYTDIESGTKTCAFLENSCQAKVEINSDGMRIYGECKELAACKQNAEDNDCYSVESADDAKVEHVCHFCCRGIMCNTAAYARRKVAAQQRKLEQKTRK